MAAYSSLQDPLLGQVLAGKYHLVEVHGGGAFGTVYLAHQLFCGHFVRHVACKVSRQAGLTDKTAAALFGDALILAQIMAGGDSAGKRHLVPIYDMGLLPECGGRGFLVMEHVNGAPLLDHIRAAGRIGVAAGLRYVKELCRGLAVVHSQGAVHRDLKPDNVLIDRAGAVRLVDFGLASFTDPDLGFAPGAIGTFTYMAPETLRGRSTAAADVYGLGLLMYELFAGGGPHLSAPWPKGDGDCQRDEHYRIKRSLVFAKPSELHNEIRNDCRWLDDLIARCLEFVPEKRFADAGQVLAAIESCEAGGTLPSPFDRGSLTGDSRYTELRARAVENEPAPGAGMEELLREVRKLLGHRDYGQAIDRLDIHRPAEWEAMRPHTARVLRALGQAYLGKGDFSAARDCLEQLRAGQAEQAVLGRHEYAGALSDLAKSYRGLGHADLAEACQGEARTLLQGD